MLEQVIPTTPSEASGNHTTELSTIGHVNPQWRWKSTFDFTQIVNNYALEANNALKYVEICFPFFSETTHAILKKNLKHALMQCG